MTESMAMWQLRRLEHYHHDEPFWPIILSFTMPSNGNIIGFERREERGRGRYWTVTKNVAERNEVYYLRVAEKAVLHHFPCCIRIRNGHLHSRPTARRSDTFEEHFDDSDEDHDATDIVYWYCMVCSATFTDERYQSLCGVCWSAWYHRINPTCGVRRGIPIYLGSAPSRTS